MTEKEKVIHGLECCIRKMEGQRICDECPYDEDFNCLGCSIVLWQAIAMLREQEAVKPQLSISGMWYECPICHRHITKDIDNYCARCGKPVKWNA